MPRLADVVAALESRWPPSLAEDWDAVGLVCGDRGAEVARALFCVDVTDGVADEAERLGADLVVAHHPPFLRGTSTLDGPTGRVVQRLVRGGTALHVAHTNADSAVGGVSDVLAGLLGVVDAVPLQPRPVEPLDLWSVLVPDRRRRPGARRPARRRRAGRLGDYDRCSWSTTGTGRFRPLDGSRPTIGRVGEPEAVEEARVQVVAPRSRRRAVAAALAASHPYEEPGADVLETVGGLVGTGARTGIGRVGRLAEPTTLAAFADAVAVALPSTAWGVRVAGDGDRRVERVAVCGGSGDSLLGAAAAAGADVYVTSDLRHHPASDARAGGGPALVDAAHWATEQPWCVAAARELSETTGVRTAVSAVRTDPWTGHAHPPPPRAPEVHPAPVPAEDRT